MNAENIILDTPRLLLREMTPVDAEQAYLLNLDPEVIRYTGDEPFDSIETARRFLSAAIKLPPVIKVGQGPCERRKGEEKHGKGKEIS